MKLFNLENKKILNMIDILKTQEINKYNFLIEKKVLIKEINTLKKIIKKFPYISVNGLKEKNLFIFINNILFKLNQDFLYREYKIVIK
jgi:hypothetical protein